MDADPRPGQGLTDTPAWSPPLGLRLRSWRSPQTRFLTFELLSRCVYTRRRASACIPGSLRAALRGQSPALRLQYRQRAERSAEKAAAGDIDGKAVCEKVPGKLGSEQKNMTGRESGLTWTVVVRSPCQKRPGGGGGWLLRS